MTDTPLVRHDVGAAVSNVRGRLGRGSWVALVVGGVCAGVGFFVAPSGGLAQAWLFVGVLGVGTIAIGVGVWRRVRSRRAVWLTLMAGQAINLVASVFWYVIPLTTRSALSFPSVADPLYVIAYATLAAGLVLLVRSRSAGRGRADLLDSLIIASGLGLVLWVFQIDRSFSQSGLSLLGRSFTVAYPLLDIVLIGLAVRMAVSSGRKPVAFWLLLLAIAGQALSDIAYTETVLRGEFRYGAPFFAGWLISYVCFGAAALHPSMATITDEVVATGRSTLRRRLPLLALAALLGPIILTVQHERGTPVNVPVVAVVTVITFLLVLARMSDLMVDVAEYERVTADLSRVALIVESSDDAIESWGADTLITGWNQGAADMFGYSAAEMVGTPVGALVSPAVQSVEADMIARVVAGDRVDSFESERVCADGSVLAVSVAVFAVRDTNDCVVGGACIVRDITALKRIEVELSAARDEALEASRLKSEFLAMMSHEIRTPMNGVIGLTELLLGTELDDRQRDFAKGVQGAGEVLLGVINDILDFSKIEAGRIEIEVVDIDLVQLIEDSAALVASSAMAKGLELIAYCRPEVPRFVRGDPVRLRQVLLNLAANAIKFTETGEVSLRVLVDPNDSASCDDDPVMVRFEVADTGIGIATADRQRLFRPFVQADASTTRRYGGTGLGLTISSQFVGAMGGNLSCVSELGSGSTFSFALALPRQPAPTATDRRAVAGVLDGRRVLVVDDNLTNRLILQSQLQSWGMRPESCDSGRAALALLHAAAIDGDPFELALLDMCMREMNGLQLATTVSADLALAATHLALLTSAVNVDTGHARDAGIVAVLSKPVRQTQLYDTLVRLVAPRTPPQPAQPAASRRASRGRVLVVEDNPVNQIVAVGIMERLGYQADVAANGVAALAAVAKNEYLAVLMDCQMPEMDGFQATAELRRRESVDSHLPIIAMTASVVDGDRQRCLAAGMDDYVTKPVKPADVSAALDRWLNDGATRVPPATAAASRDEILDSNRIRLLFEMGENPGSLLARLVALFTAEAPEMIAALHDATDAGDLTAVGAHAHRLSGSAANLGATRLSAQCCDLQTATAAGVADTALLLNEIDTELARVVDALERTTVSPAAAGAR